jgi:DNA-binding MarR family transcriptional regulator
VAAGGALSRRRRRKRIEFRVHAVKETMATRSAPAVEEVDTGFLESLLGYNARRAALAVITVFLDRMAPYQLRPVDFSVLSLIKHNPGITSRQLCTSLGILPPNLVGLVNALQKRELIERKPHPRDGRAVGLHLTGGGQKLMRDAERTAASLEAEVAGKLTPAELRTLMKLLKKVYQ